MKSRLGWALALAILSMIAACGAWADPHGPRWYESRPAAPAAPNPSPPNASVDPAERPECIAVPGTVGIYDCTSAIPPNAGYTPTYAPAPSGGPVHVRGYYRRDGTYVRPHTRRRPR